MGNPVGSVSKPAVRSVWATVAAGGSIADPGDSFASTGWPLSTTPPARQYFNWLDNYNFNGVRYQCSRGLPDWDALETFYSVGSVVIGDNGLIYASLQVGPGSTGSGTNLNKPPSTNPTYWGPIKLVTPAASDNSNSAATTAYVTSAVATASAAQTAALNTEISNRTTAVSGEASARATGDANTLSNAETYTNAAVAPLAPLASPNFTGVPTAPTPSAGDSSQKIATTAFVGSRLGAETAKYSASGTVTTSPTTVVDGIPVVPGATYVIRLTGGFTISGGITNLTTAVVSDQGGTIVLPTAAGTMVFGISGSSAGGVLYGNLAGCTYSGFNGSTLSMDASGTFTTPAGCTSVGLNMNVGTNSFNYTGISVSLERVA